MLIPWISIAVKLFNLGLRMDFHPYAGFHAYMIGNQDMSIVETIGVLGCISFRLISFLEVDHESVG